MKNKNDKKKFVNDLVDDIRRMVNRRISKGFVPADWDGIELRQYLADQFAGNTMPMKGRRLKSYKNDITITSGL